MLPGPGPAFQMGNTVFLPFFTCSYPGSDVMLYVVHSFDGNDIVSSAALMGATGCFSFVSLPRFSKVAQG